VLGEKPADPALVQLGSIVPAPPAKPVAAETREEVGSFGD
jgi:hypothetical protein